METGNGMEGKETEENIMKIENGMEGKETLKKIK